MNDQELIHRLIDIFKFKEEYQLKSSGLLPQDMYILERIYFGGKVTPKDLSEKYHIPPSTLTGIIDRLEKNDLINRVRGNKNRRVVYISLTDKGIHQIKHHIKEDKIFSYNFFRPVKGDKGQQLRQLLIEVLDGINKDTLFNEGALEND
ncbi:MarR family winged helix-turn-helix transcriptional regulator [Alkaliphilus serpentinus]|uniref:MarR family transcriptional regulator n=1 Tax=Alkaliphilus serpentinus TaxID=1482731 RepID=A0A833HMQ9_9FIRM|nr:MarR family transcriptional regulator [Alkaliphilus serpentinus]KAB3528795.1 MarR family transcriptional regulator [Alkaliphilus serpentinus]